MTLERLSDYSLGLDGLAEEAGRQVMARLASRWQEVCGLEPKDSVPIMREEATAALVDAENTFGVSSAAIGHNMLADVVGKSPGRGIEGMEVADAYADSQSARYWAKHLDGTDEGFEKFLEGVVARAKRNVSHAADREVALASAKMGRAHKGVRFARVPSGPSCGFCIMLASRGFVYATRESAGEFTRFHDDCDCRIVAGMQGMEVEGYDPDGLYDRYARCVMAINGDTLSSSNGRIFEDWDRLTPEEQAEWGKKAKNGKDAFNNYFEHRVCREMDTRDREWLWSGTEPEIDYSKKARDAYGVMVSDPADYSSRSFEWRGNEWKDLFAHDSLSASGFLVCSHETIENGGETNIDIDLNGNRCEVKSPEAVPNPSSKDELKFIQRNVQTARHQLIENNVSERRIVISNYYTGFYGEDEDRVFQRFRKEIELQGFIEALFIKKDGTVLRAK